jgi:hypothetical protein
MELRQENHRWSPLAYCVDRAVQRAVPSGAAITAAGGAGGAGAAAVAALAAGAQGVGAEAVDAGDEAVAAARTPPIRAPTARPLIAPAVQLRIAFPLSMILPLLRGFLTQTRASIEAAG